MCPHRPSPAALADERHGFIAFLDEERDADPETFVRVLGQLVESIRGHGIEYVLIGGICSTAQGRERLTHDIDVFVRPSDAEAVVQAMDELGWETQRTDPNWIYKGFCDGVIVDVIFKAKGGIYLDDAMLERATPVEFRGVTCTMAPAEDMIVMKAIAADDDSPRHWYDALGLLAARGGNIDWPYLVHRAQWGPRRVLSLLLYAEADDLPVPADVPPALFELMHPASGLPAGVSTL